MPSREVGDRVPLEADGAYFTLLDPQVLSLCRLHASTVFITPMKWGRIAGQSGFAGGDAHGYGAPTPATHMRASSAIIIADSTQWMGAVPRFPIRCRS